MDVKASEQAFKELIQGSTVSVVGRATPPRLKQSAAIDHSDVVVRMHNPAPYHTDIGSHGPSKYRLSQAIHDEVGNKTTVFYVSNLPNNSEIHEMISNLEQDGCKFICCEPDVDFFEASRVPRLWTRMMPFSRFVECYNKIDSRPLLGTLIIEDILSYSPAKVYLTGFPCWINDNGEIENHDIKVRYNAWNDFNYLKRLWWQNPNTVSVDSEMNTMFQKFGVWLAPEERFTDHENLREVAVI